MGRLLLSSGQVSVALTSIVIITFTFLLFLAGYILQQQSVHQLRLSIRPQEPSPRWKSNPDPIQPFTPQSRLSRPLGRLEEQIHWHEPKAFDWSRLAYAQIARNHEDLCHSLIILHELHRLKSPAPRLLLFPRTWVDEHGGEEEGVTRELDQSLRLLKKASRVYRAVLVPMETFESGANETSPNSYSVASVFSLTNYDRVMVLPKPGLILNTRPLDSILAYSDVESLSAFPDIQPSAEESPSMLLIRPSKKTHDRLLQSHQSKKQADMSLLHQEFPNPPALLANSDPDFKPSLYTTLEKLRTVPNFNATSFSDTTAYLRLEDSKLPGPEYDVPYQMIVGLRPKDDDQGFIWEKMYSTYKDRRYRVCGLDLIDWTDKQSPKTELK